jgi:thiamine kinase-like enzyme
MVETLQQVIARIPGWASAGDLQVERIAGLTNANYCVTVNGERFVLRVSGDNTAHLGIDRRHERDALLAASAAGIAPQLVAFLLPEGHLVTRWVEGRHWEYAEYRTPHNVCLLTSTAKRIHALPPTGAVFSPFRRVDAYLETARRNGVPLPGGLDRCLETMKRVEQHQQADRSDWRHFCHNDLVAVNYLVDDKNESITVLDWEFSGLGDIYYDLATVVYTHDNEGPIPPELEQVMLDCYFGEASDHHRQRLQGMKYMLMLFTGMWGLAQHGMQLAGLVPPVEGFDYLEFARYLFAHDIQELRSSL